METSPLPQKLFNGFDLTEKGSALITKTLDIMYNASFYQKQILETCLIKIKSHTSLIIRKVARIFSKVRGTVLFMLKRYYTLDKWYGVKTTLFTFAFISAFQSELSQRDEIGSCMYAYLSV